MVIQNKKEQKKESKCFAIAIGGGGGLGERVSMVYGVCVRLLSGRTVKRCCASGDDIQFQKRGMPVRLQRFSFLAFENWQGGAQRQAGQTQKYIKRSPEHHVPLPPFQEGKAYTSCGENYGQP